MDQSKKVRVLEILSKKVICIKYDYGSIDKLDFKEDKREWQNLGEGRIDRI